MEYKDILVQTQGEIGLITLNSPSTVNALSKNMVREVIRALEHFRVDASLKAIILKANGKHFCAGHYLKEMIDGNVADYRFIFNQCTTMMKMIHSVPQVVIAQVHGVATAAGCQLVASCDLAIADDTARFGTPGVKIGLFCTTPMIALSRAVGRKLALEMLMTGRLIPAQEALQYGLINKVVPKQDLANAVKQMAEAICEASPLVLTIGKRAFYHQIELDEQRAYEYATEVITQNLMAEDAQEGIKAFLAKRKPTWQGR